MILPDESPAPAYDFTDGQQTFEKDEKGSLDVDSDDEEAPPTFASGSSAGDQRGVDAGGPPHSFHVYKAEGFFGNDDLIMGDDKTTVLYYLDFPLKMTGWNLTLHKGSKEGPVVSRITKSGFNTAFEIKMESDGFTTQLKRPKVLTTTHEFTGRDGTTRFKWSSEGLRSSIRTLTNLENKDVAATFRTTSITAKKNGQLLINASYTADLELILTTGLAVNEWVRQQNGSTRII